MRLLTKTALLVLLVTHSQAHATPSPSFADVIGDRFEAWDGNFDGALTIDEVERVIVDPQVKGPDAAAAVAIRRTLRNSKYGISKLTLAELNELASEKKSSGKPNLNAMYNSALTKLSKINRDLFSNGSPNLDAIHQGKLGNCYCLAPLAGMVYREPSELATRIECLATGEYIVRLGAEPIVVSPLTDGELAYMATSGGDGIWVNVYEKAVGQRRVLKLPESERPITVLGLFGKGGSAGTSIEGLTGNKIVRFSCNYVRDPKLNDEQKAEKLADLSRQLESAFAERRLVTCGTGRTSGIKVPGIHRNHAYAVLGYDSSRDAIRIWNPHGQKFTPKGSPGLEYGYSTSHGQFNMPLADFVQVFAGVAFETTERRNIAKTTSELNLLGSASE